MSYSELICHVLTGRLDYPNITVCLIVTYYMLCHVNICQRGDGICGI